VAAPESLLRIILLGFLLCFGAWSPIAACPIGKGEVTTITSFGGETIGKGADVVSGEVREAGLVGLLADFEGRRRSLNCEQRIYFSRLAFIPLIVIICKKVTLLFLLPLTVLLYRHM
jgi:hypothetical protein